MPSPVITPNMFLTEPAVGVTLSPGWALLLNANFQVIDQHNHTNGQGVPIPPAGLNINSDLSFQGNNLLAVNSLVYNGAVSGIPAVLSTYTDGTDLFYKDVHGNAIKLTTGGSPASATGNIQGLPSTPTGGASLTWINATSTFDFTRDSGAVGANVEMGTLVLRYPGSYPTPTGTNFVALEVPAAISAGYAMKMPLALPGSQKFMTLDAAGNIAAPWSVDNSTVEIASGTTLRVKANGITSNELATNSVYTNAIQALAVTTAKIAAAAVTSSKIGNGEVKNANLDSNLNLPGTTVQINSRNPVVGSTGDSAGAVVIVCGTVASNGAPSTGIGFTSAQTGTGTYSMTFNDAFTTLYSVVITAGVAGTNARAAVVTGFNTTGVTWSTQDFSNTNANSDSYFIAIGKK